MKKNLALLLAFVMLVGCVLGIMPVADETDAGGESYKPAIAYSNVNYTEDLVLMFAVPAPEAGAIDAESSVKLLLWVAPSSVYSYKESITTNAYIATALALEAEADKVTLGGKEHLVYKYSGLDASKMTDVVYARAVVVDKDNTATAYGDVLDYSIVEYVETAKGSFGDGNLIVADDVVDLLDSMLGFGAVVQGLANNGIGYAPKGYLANDDLHKIWVTPVVAGKKLDKVFGGFFKYEEGGYATVCDPFFDGYTAVTYKDADGNLLEDVNPALNDEALGHQIYAVDEDIEVTVEYGPVTIRSLVANDYGADFLMNNTEDLLNRKPYGNSDIINNLQPGFNTKNWQGYLRRGTEWNNVSFDLVTQAGHEAKTYYSGIKTVADPTNPDNFVFMVTGTSNPLISFSTNFGDVEKAMVGFGDTLDNAVTIEFEVGKPSADANVTAYGLYLRNTSAWSAWSKDVAYDGTAPAINTYSGESFFNYIVKIVNNQVMLTKNNTVICELPDEGLVKIAVTVCDSDLKVYYSDENGEMVLALSGPAEDYMKLGKEYTEKHAQHIANGKDNNPDNDNDLLPYASISNWLTMNEIKFCFYAGPQGASDAYSTTALKNKYPTEFANASVEIDGQTVPVQTGVDADGKPILNPTALQLYAEKNYSFLLGYFKVYVGDAYK